MSSLVEEQKLVEDRKLRRKKVQARYFRSEKGKNALNKYRKKKREEKIMARALDLMKCMESSMIIDHLSPLCDMKGLSINKL